MTGWFRSSNGIAVSFLWTHPPSTLKERKYNLITSWPPLLCLPPFNWNPTIPNLATLSGCPLYEFSSNANQFWTALCHQTVCHQHSKLLLPIVVSLKVGPDFLLESSLIFSPLLNDISPSLQKSQVFNLNLSMWRLWKGLFSCRRQLFVSIVTWNLCWHLFFDKWVGSLYDGCSFELSVLPSAWVAAGNNVS